MARDSTAVSSLRCRWLQWLRKPIYQPYDHLRPSLMAVNTLAQVMADQAAPASARVSAAIGLLRFGREGIELDDLAARLEALENAAPQREKAPRWR